MCAARAHYGEFFFESQMFSETTRVERENHNFTVTHGDRSIFSSPSLSLLLYFVPTRDLFSSERTGQQTIRGRKTNDFERIEYIERRLCDLQKNSVWQTQVTIYGMSCASALVVVYVRLVFLLYAFSFECNRFSVTIAAAVAAIVVIQRRPKTKNKDKKTNLIK